MISLISFIGVLSVLVIVHEFGHFIVAKRMGVRVEKFSIGFGPELFGITLGGTRYLVSIVPLGGYVKLAGETVEDELKGEKWEYLSRSVGERARIIFAGPLLNYVLAYFIFTLIFILGYPTQTTKIGKLLSNYPGEAAGLKLGDRITEVNGKKVKYWDELTSIVYTNKGPELDIVIDRNGEILRLKVFPKTEELKTIFGSKKRVGLIGILPSEEVAYVKSGIIKSFYMGMEKLFHLTYITYRAIWASITGAIPFKESITGPVGIFYITGQAARLGMLYLLHLIAILSASLAIFNLLPFPVLDGGHIFFLLVEKLRRKPLSHKFQENVTQAGFVLLISLMLFVFYNDIIRYGILDKLTNLFKK